MTMGGNRKSMDLTTLFQYSLMARNLQHLLVQNETSGNVQDHSIAAFDNSVYLLWYI